MYSLFDFIISPDSSLQAALEQMTRNHKGLLFVCDESAHIVGVISDGDFRRALVGKALLVASVGTYMNLDPVVAVSVDQGKHLLAKHSLLAIPIVDQAGKIVSAVVQDVDRVIVVGMDSDDVTENQPVPGVIAVIPARGGSKRITRKNRAPLAGKPLLAYAIEAAQKAKCIKHIIVSTDDIEIADVARTQGIDVPWLRPAHLAQDTTSSIEVVLHAVEWARGHYGHGLQYGVLLEPTAPLRTHFQIEQAIEVLKSTGADSVVSVCKAPHIFNPEELLVIQNEELRPYLQERTLDTRLLRGRQSPVYVQNGLVYAFNLDMLLARKSFYGEMSVPFVVDWEYFLDIDVPSDLELAEYRIRQFRH